MEGKKTRVQGCTSPKRKSLPFVRNLLTELSSIKYFFFSAILHVLLLLILIAGLDSVSPLFVIENSNKQDVINVVMLGDTAESKIIREEVKSLPELDKSSAKSKPIVKNEKVIALNKPIFKKSKPEEIFGKDLLADIKKQTNKQKKLKQQKLKDQFEKTLREEAEKTLRQQLMNENIKMAAKENRLSQGEINKYKALILQAISQNWIVPVQANKKRSSELMIRLAPGGTVLDVQVTKSSGDTALDRSARAAVLKASPLPVPENIDAFEPFRQFVLKVKPEIVTDSTV